MVQIEALRLFILGIADQRVDGSFGPARTLHRLPGALQALAVALKQEK